MSTLFRQHRQPVHSVMYSGGLAVQLSTCALHFFFTNQRMTGSVGSEQQQIGTMYGLSIKSALNAPGAQRPVRYLGTYLITFSPPTYLNAYRPQSFKMGGVCLQSHSVLRCSDYTMIEITIQTSDTSLLQTRNAFTVSKIQNFPGEAVPLTHAHILLSLVPSLF